MCEIIIDRPLIPVLTLLSGESAVRFLTRTFRNVSYVRVGKRYVRLWRSQRS